MELSRRLNAVAGEAAAQAVGPVVHGPHGVGDPLAGHLFSLFGDDRGDGTAGRNANLSL